VGTARTPSRIVGSLEISTKAACASLGYAPLVLIPKELAGQRRGVALLEAASKLVSSVINLEMQAAVTLHDDVHSVARRSYPMATGIIEATLLAWEDFISNQCNVVPYYLAPARARTKLSSS
jgi:hypothetical protein